MSVAAAPGLTRALAQRSSSLRLDELPGDVVEIARQALLDWFGVTLGASREPAALALIETLPAVEPSDPAAVSLVGHARRAGARDAALINGTASHALDFDDVNISAVCHVSAATLGAALALAERRGASGGELLAAYVAGYETACRVAAAVGPQPYARGFHSTGTIGTFGACAAAARLLGLDAERTSVAFGIAASEAAGLKCNVGTMTKPLHAGRACESGLLAALLAERGFTANASAIEAEQGFAALSGGDCDVAGALAQPRAGWHVRENLFKYHAACFFTHSMIEGLRELRATGEIAAQGVSSVRVEVGEVQRGVCAIAAPTTGLEVKFSMAHLAALELLGRDTAVIGDAQAHDAEAIALRARVQLLDGGRDGSPTRVAVELVDGTTRHAAVDVRTPQRDLAAQRERLAGKFSSLAVPVLGDDRAAELHAVAGGLAEDADVRALMSLSTP